jgi:hypothetical protein
MRSCNTAKSNGREISRDIVMGGTMTDFPVTASIFRVRPKYLRAVYS